MWRMGAIMLAAYVGGGDMMKDYRPESLDKPLKGFHATVNSFAKDGKEVLGVMNDMRTNKALQVYQRELTSLVED